MTSFLVDPKNNERPRHDILYLEFDKLNDEVNIVDAREESHKVIDGICNFLKEKKVSYTRTRHANGFSDWLRIPLTNVPTTTNISKLEKYKENIASELITSSAIPFSKIKKDMRVIRGNFEVVTKIGGIHWKHKTKEIVVDKFSGNPIKIDNELLQKLKVDDGKNTNSYNKLNPDDYGDWIKMGFRLKSQEYIIGESALLAWIEWSKKSSKYKDGECEKKWNTFKIKDTESNEKEVYKYRNLSELLSKPAPPVEYVIDPFVVYPGVTVVSGEPKGCKSILVQQMCICASVGLQLFNKHVTKKVRILIIDSENGIPVLHRRFEQISKALDVHKDLLKDVEITTFPLLTLDSPTAKQNLERMISDTKPDLVIFDSLTRFIDGDENSSSDMRKIFWNIKDIVHNEQHKRSIIIIHHMNKGNGVGANRVRGSGDFVAMADVIITMTKKKKYIEMDVVAHRHREYDNLKIKLELSATDDTLLLGESTLNSMTKQDECKLDVFEFIQSNGVTKAEEVHKKLGNKYFRSTIIKALNFLCDSNKIEKPKRGVYQEVKDVSEESV